VETSATASLS